MACGPLNVSDVEGTEAFKTKRWVIRDGGKKKYDRLLQGDFLRTGGKKPSSKRMTRETLQACFASVPQGDHLGVEVATEGHRNFLRSWDLLADDNELRAGSPFRGRDLATGLVIDDFYAISIEKASLPAHSPGEDLLHDRPLAVAQLVKAQAAYEAEGLLGSPQKDVRDACKAKVSGAEFDSSSCTRNLGLTTVAAPAQKRLALAFISSALSTSKWTTDALHACLLGGWVHALLYRRPAMSIAQRCFGMPLQKLLRTHLASFLLVVGSQRSWSCCLFYAHSLLRICQQKSSIDASAQTPPTARGPLYPVSWKRIGHAL